MLTFERVRPLLLSAVRALLCACAVALCVVGAAARQSDAKADAQAEARRREAWLELLKFEGQELDRFKGDAADTIVKLANRLLPDRKDPDNFAVRSRRPHLLARVRTSAGARLVLLDSQFFCISPGQTWHYVYFFDESGKLLGSSDFAAGWRVCPSGARLTTRAGFDAPLLKMDGGGLGSFAFAPGVSAYYALLGDRAVLVRLEDGAGRVLRNWYGCEYPLVGPTPPERTAEEWVRALSSPDKVEVLQALLWVGGLHHKEEDLKYDQEEHRRLRLAYPDEPAENMNATLDRCPAALEEARRYAALVAREDLRPQLERLADSGDEWVRQAARAALDPPKNNHYR